MASSVTVDERAVKAFALFEMLQNTESIDSMDIGVILVMSLMLWGDTNGFDAHDLEQALRVSTSILHKFRDRPCSPS